MVFGRTSKKQAEVCEIGKEYKIRYSLIEPNLKYGFEYSSDCFNAIVIEKNINIRDFNEQEFERDLEYITNLYKAYEQRFENFMIYSSEQKEIVEIQNDKISYEEINERMLMLIEEVGNLAKAIKDLGK